MNHEGLARNNPSQHGFLLGVGVQQQGVGGRDALVGPGHHRNRPAQRHGFPIGGMTGEGVQNRVVQLGRVACHRGADVHERRDHKPRLDHKRRNLRHERPQVIDHRLRLEDALIVGKTRQGVAVEFDPEVHPHRTQQFGIDLETAVQLQFEVGVVTTDREWAQQHGSDALEPPDAP